MIRLSLLALLASVTVAHAGVSDFSIARLLDFAHVVTGLKDDGTRPKIVYRTQEQLDRMALGDNYKPALAGWIGALESGGVIFLSDDFQIGRDNYILAHELTHFLQFENAKYHDVLRGGAEMPYDPGTTCAGLVEPEAYHVQDVYVAATGIGKRSDPFTVFSIVSACQQE